MALEPHDMDMVGSTNRAKSWQTELADVNYWRRNIPCQDACPVHTDARGYVRAISSGDFESAYLIARGPNPLASLCGRVCGAPCQRNCRRGNIDEPIAIRALKRFAIENGQTGDAGSADMRTRMSTLLRRRECSGVEEIQNLLNRFKDLPLGRPTGERIAIIGSGPAGLSCAHDLSLMGFRPVIFEMEAVPAGMLAVGVPEYRLPRDVIRSEVDLIEALGTEIRCSTEVGKDIQFHEILDEFKAIVIAVGAKKSRLLPIPGIEGPGVLGGVEFLRDVAYDREVNLGRSVVVIGGGNVAYDAARTVVRQAYVDISRTAMRQQRVEEVHLTCLETLTDMPADDIEIIEGDEEGVVRKNGWGPTEIERDKDGKVCAVKFQRCLSTLNDEGRFSPVFDPEQSMTIPCDTVIITVGQSVELSFIDAAQDGIEITERGLPAADSETLTTSREGVFVAGDVVMGMGLMIDAIASGKKAARSVYKYLTGDAPSPRMTDFHHILSDYMREADYEKTNRVEVPVLPAEERKKSQKVAVENGFDAELAMREASRCLDCGVNTIFDGTKCVLCGGCVDVCPTLCLKIVSASDLAENGLLTDVAEATKNAADWREGSAIIKDEDKCIRCANCAERCPSGAITMERFCYEESAI